MQIESPEKASDKWFHGEGEGITYKGRKENSRKEGGSTKERILAKEEDPARILAMFSVPSVSTECKSTIDCIEITDL